ncbi:hypothetical protein UAW_02029 [Enterococcus haemoperoxidus ATCC BAA-382]|uniref:DUF5105 domain-containing protein n=1 Tax=Enterococcus haemoperoxidus ATCC BAA-382 TaxID=1158608 RepID=R2SIB7_9ENTE|nr:DUF5105 domain-containing protein [Enterococcus haemoperoxidus]EOH94950.1 hypothetical protein UAW_02029 [Enterococcus haemoperoxidus ATCC BAA-382]EOT60349.1 hypothetical protein I583_02995 [Enterococcus haemoperoxidus ATCC BAA-382]OJG54779.1 hypothetical protein RV06_GL002301 [Enterococcus haemoperoxidus]
MKKLWIISLLLAGVFLTSCGSKGISAEDAGALFVDRLVYQKEENKFAKEFRDGEQVGKELDENSKTFEENFAKGLSSTGAKVPKKEADQLTNELLQQARQKTTYKIVQIDETKSGATITYYVTGLDLVSAMQEMTRQLVKDTLADPEIAKDEQKTLEATFSILEERVKAIKIKTDPVKMTLHLEKEKGKWFVPDNQKKAVSNLFMAFISGSKDIDTMNKELEEALNEVAKEIINSLDTITIPDSD